MELNFHRLWLFLQVIECGGFSAAASKLFMSQPSVSNQVRQLETSIGATLVDRSGTRTTPTAEGEVLAAYARRLFLLADEAVAAVHQVQGLAVGQLAVGGSTTVGTYLLPPLLARFRREHPSIEADLYVANAEQVTRRLLDGELGLAVVAGRPDLSQVQWEEVLTDRLVLITPPDHPLAGRPADAAELADERFLLRERGSYTRELQDTALAGWGLDQVSAAEMWGPETLKQSVHAGLGLSLISAYAVRHEVAEGRLGTVAIEPTPPERPIVAVHRRDRLLSPAEAAFLGVLRQTHEWPPGL